MYLYRFLIHYSISVEKFHVLFQEAQTLSALAAEMAANGYSLYAVLHEELGWEEFATQVFHPHPVYLDVEVS